MQPAQDVANHAVRDGLLLAEGAFVLGHGFRIRAGDDFSDKPNSDNRRFLATEFLDQPWSTGRS